MDMSVVIGTLLNLFALLIFGYFLNKIHIIDHVANLKISNLIVNVTAPLLVLSSVKGTSIRDGGSSTVWFLLIGSAVFYLILPVIAKLIVIPMKLPANKSHVYQMFFIYTNLGFMGFPVARSIYGQQGLFLMAIVNMCFGISCFSYGIYLLRKGKDTEQSFQWKSLLNPGIIACILALIIYLTGVPVPDQAMDLCKMVGEVTVPLSMMIIGASLGEVPLRKLAEYKSLYIVVFLCMLAEPWLVYHVASLFTADKLAVGILTLSIAMPGASIIAMLCNKYEVEPDVASAGVFLTTLVSLVSIPVIVSGLLM